MNRPLIFDIETIAHAEAVQAYVPAPDLNAIKAGKNLKDPEKIAADLQQRRAAAEAANAEARARAALDWNLSRIVALGVDSNGWQSTYLCRDEAAEAVILTQFWREVRDTRPTLIGFCARTFDVPTLIQRSRLLGVPYPPINLARYGRGDVTDLRDLLTFDDMRYEALMPRSLKAFARRFGISVDDPVDGCDIAQLVSEGRWDAVEAHVRSDVQLTRRLAERLRIVEPVAFAPVETPVEASDDALIF